MSILSNELSKISDFISLGLGETYDSVDESRVRTFVVNSSYEGSNYYTNIEYDDDKNLIGFCLGIKQMGMFDDSHYGILLEMYVINESRDTQLAKEMLTNFEAWATERGVKEISTFTNDSYKTYLVPNGYEIKASLFVKPTS